MTFRRSHVEGSGWIVLQGPDQHIEGHVLLTILVRVDDDGFYVGECVELGVPSFGETLDEAIKAVLDATVLYLNTVEVTGERERVLDSRGVKLIPGLPEGLETIEVVAHPGETISSQSVALLAGA